MTPPEIDQMREALQNIRQQSVPELIAAEFPNEDLTAKRFTNLTASQFISLLDRAVAQFTEAIEHPDAFLLCRGFYWETSQQGMSHRNVASVVQQLANLISAKNWAGASHQLELIIGYLMQAGYWDRSSRKLQSIGKLRQSELFMDLEAKARQFTEIQKQLNDLRAQQQQETTKREADAAAVASELSKAQKQAAEIETLVKTSTGQNGQLVQILSTQSENLEKAKVELKASQEIRAKLTEELRQAAEALSSSEARLKFMESKEAWVNKLAGTAAAGVLGQKFEARMRELSTASNWWLAGTILSVVAGAVWIGLAHKYFMQSGSDVWLTLALNFGLLLPALFIVGFFAKQFGKVRQFEEEYAFRSSVAMTLSAFADRLENDVAERNKLIADTVEKLYSTPVLLQEHEPDGWFTRRSTERMLKATTELVAAVKRPNQ